LIKELINAKEASANLDVDAIFVNLDIDFLAAKFIDTLTLTHEHDLELLTVGVVVDVFGQAAVNLIILHRDVNSNTRFQVNDVLLERFDFDFTLLEGVEQLEGVTVGLVNLVFESSHVTSCSEKVVLQAHVALLVLAQLISQRLDVAQGEFMILLQHRVLLPKSMVVAPQLVNHLAVLTQEVLARILMLNSYNRGDKLFALLDDIRAHVRHKLGC